MVIYNLRLLFLLFYLCRNFDSKAQVVNFHCICNLRKYIFKTCRHFRILDGVTLFSTSKILLTDEIYWQQQSNILGNGSRNIFYIDNRILFFPRCSFVLLYTHVVSLHTIILNRLWRKRYHNTLWFWRIKTYV